MKVMHFNMPYVTFQLLGALGVAVYEIFHTSFMFKPEAPRSEEAGRPLLLSRPKDGPELRTIQNQTPWRVVLLKNVIVAQLVKDL
jgi:hypothetical protein